MAYSDAERAEAIVRLAKNGYDFTKTAQELDLQVRTLRRWDKIVPKKGVAELLERAIQKVLLAVPEAWSGNDWAVTAGILIDKWLLMSGKPTSRAENITRKLGGMSEDEFADVLDEANQILDQAAARTSPGRSPDPGDLESPE